MRKIPIIYDLVWQTVKPHIEVKYIWTIAALRPKRDLIYAEANKN